MSRPQRLPLVLASVLLAAPAHAADAVGPEWLKLVSAFPIVVLQAVGQFSLFIAPLLALLSITTWGLNLTGSRLAKHVPNTATLVTLTILTAVPAAIYWANAPDASSDPFKSYRSSTQPDRKVRPLKPPVGRTWPSKTGYLDMSQGAQGGHGVIRLAGTSTYLMYVKLCEAVKGPCSGLRHAVVRGTDVFEFRNLPPGAYEIRYMPIARPLVGGRSQPISITEAAGEHKVDLDSSPVLESNYPVVGILPQEF